MGCSNLINISKKDELILCAKTVFSEVIPIIFSSTISHNKLGLLDSGTGLGDLLIGPF
ncbi:MAG: hypothetical protein K2X90_01435 [Candidatus Babeliaceae bacterium]|nr:hypothetical protein [Candidatus Babeliaceae bacterium]